MHSIKCSGWNRISPAWFRAIMRSSILLALVMGFVRVTLAQTPPVLLKEAISREVSIQVGGVQTPEYKETICGSIRCLLGMNPPRLSAKRSRAR